MTMAKTFIKLLSTATLAMLACSLKATPSNALSEYGHGHVKSRHNTWGHEQPYKRSRRRAVVSPKVDSGSATANTAGNAEVDALTDPQAVGNLTGRGSGYPHNGSGHNLCKNKAGLAWNLGDEEVLKDWAPPGGGSCMYSWSSWPQEHAASAGMIFCPMIWGASEDKVQEFNSNMPKFTSPTMILGFNEPNQDGQSNMSPQQALEAWWAYVEPHKENGHTLVSPATSSADNGFTWMQEFMSGCPECHIDAVALHWYGTDPQAFIVYVQKFIDEFGLPVLVTEFACHDFGGNQQCSYDQTVEFLKETTDWLENEPQVWAYMAFGALRDMVGVSPADQLLDASNDEPNELGRKYINHAF